MLRGVGEESALGLEVKGLRRVASEDGERVAGGEQAGGHGGAHQAYANPADAGCRWRYGCCWIRGFHRFWRALKYRESESSEMKI